MSACPGVVAASEVIADWYKSRIQMRILFVSFGDGEAAAALIEDGRVVAAASESRFSRVPEDAGFPEHAVRFCLHRGQIGVADLDHVAFFEQPRARLESIWRAARTGASGPSGAAGALGRDLGWWARNRAFLRRRLERRLGVPADRVVFVSRHEAHAAAGFFCSPFETAAVLTVGRAAEGTTVAVGSGRGVRLALNQVAGAPHDLSRLNIAFAEFLGFGADDDGRVMDLAGHGEPRFEDEIRRMVRLESDGRIELDLACFELSSTQRPSYSPKFASVFGTPRAAGAPVQPYADLAASVQRVLGTVLTRLATIACERAGETRLCLSGELARNSVVVSRILQETGVTEIFVPPAAGSASAALGAALHIQHQMLGLPRASALGHAYWGGTIEPSAARAAASRSGLVWVECDEDELAGRTVDLLAARRVVGWAQGEFEWGDHALGNRSVLADPRHQESRLAAAVVSGREAFRAAGVSVIAEEAAAWFDLRGVAAPGSASFQTVALPPRDRARELLRGIAHPDGLARVHVVTQEANPRFHALIARFAARTSVPALLNLPFRAADTPLVGTADDALGLFLSGGLDALVMDRVVVFKD
jgi:carbamoyltransferase